MSGQAQCPAHSRAQTCWPTCPPLTYPVHLGPSLGPAAARPRTVWPRPRTAWPRPLPPHLSTTASSFIHPGLSVAPLTPTWPHPHLPLSWPRHSWPSPSKLTPLWPYLHLGFICLQKGPSLVSHDCLPLSPKQLAPPKPSPASFMPAWDF